MFLCHLLFWLCLCSWKVCVIAEKEEWCLVDVQSFLLLIVSTGTEKFFQKCSSLGSTPLASDSRAAVQVIEKPPNLRFADEQKSTSFGSTEVAVANFSFVIFLFSLFLTFQRWSFVIYQKPMAVDQGDKNSLRYRTYRLRKCVKNWNDKGGLIACCYWAIVPWLEN